MFTKVLIVSAIVAAVNAQSHGGQGHGHGHGHAYSSQSIVLHQSPAHSKHAVPAVLVQHQPAHHQHHNDHHYHAHPKYEFSYKVQDPHTGDNKYQHEARDGDVVKGVYSLHEADGTVRIVEYHADKHSGFNAVVKHEGHAKHAVPVKHNNYHH